MKRLMPACAVLVAMGSAAPSPAAEVSRGWDAVLLGGASRSYFSGSDKQLLGDESRNGFTAGVGFVLRVNEDFGFEAGVRYTEKGGQGNVDLTDYTEPNQGPTFVGNGTTRLGYVEIPVVMDAHLALSNETYVRAYAGPSFNLLVSGTFDGTLGGEPVSDVDIRKGLQDYEFSLAIGGSLVYDAGDFSLWLDGRWQLGLNSISDLPQDRDIKNNTGELALGVGIPLERE